MPELRPVKDRDELVEELVDTSTYVDEEGNEVEFEDLPEVDGEEDD